MRRLPLFTGLVFFLWPVAAQAQVDTGSISGRITDQQGQVLVGASINITNDETGFGLSTRSNSDGVYLLTGLRPGPYRMLVEMEGFRPVNLTGLTVEVQDALGRNFALQIGPREETVTVVAGQEENKLSSAVSTVINQQFVANMPLNGRSFQSLILLTPGIIATPANQLGQGQFSVDGQRTNTNYFSVDGVSANFGSTASLTPAQSFGGSLPAFTIGGGTNAFVSVDAMQEFRILTSTYSPEFGRSPGAQIAIVTKSGTNLFHGTAFDYLRNDIFDARNYFNTMEQIKPALRQNDFGGTLGGPIFRNHSFFFFSYEGLRLHQPYTASSYFYTKETRAAVAPVYQPMVNALAMPNGPLQDPTCDNITTPCLASLTASDSSPSSFDAFSLRLDHKLDQRVTFFARYSHAPSVGRFAQGSAFTLAQWNRLNSDTATAGAIMLLGPTRLNDFRANWSRSFGQNYFTQEATNGAVPPPPSAIFRPGDSFDRNETSICFPDIVQCIDVGTRAANVQRQLNFIDTFSISTGTHQLKFGADYRYLRPTSQQSNGYSMLINSFSQLKAGTFNRVTLRSSGTITARLDNWSLFAQDTWKAKPRLTVTYGLRWEINTPPVSTTPGKPLYAIKGIFDSSAVQLAPAGTPLWNTRYGNIAPRLGAAFQFDSRTVLRGGFGLFHDLGYSAELGGLMYGFPNSRYTSQSFPEQEFRIDSPALLPPPASLSLPGQMYVPAFDPQLNLPITWHWNAAMERRLGTIQSLSLTYLGARGQRLLRPDLIVPSGLSPNTSFASTRNAGYSRYNALQIQFQRPLNRGLQVWASYGLADSDDTESDDAGGIANNFVANGNTAASLGQLPIPTLTRSDFDLRHSFSAAISYEIPAPSLGRAARAVLKDWAVDGIMHATSGPPLNVRIGGRSSALGYYYTQPDTVAGQSFWIPAAGQPAGKILNPDAFTLPAEGVAGDFPRNSLQSPFGTSEIDLALRRRFHFNERVALDFRAEYFNVLNHPMFGGPLAPWRTWGYCLSRPCTGKQNPNFGKVSPGPFPGTLNQGLGGGLQYGGQNPLYASGGPRSGQFTLKLQF